MGGVAEGKARQEWGEGSGPDAAGTAAGDCNPVGIGKGGLGKVHASAQVTQPTVKTYRRPLSSLQAKYQFELWAAPELPTICSTHPVYT